MGKPTGGKGKTGGFRYGIGTSVLCRIGLDEWGKGKIVALNYAERGWPPDTYSVAAVEP